ncbi:MAG: 4Fe-4S dicluster domain-containing protein [Nitrososphaerota archaeon]|nr:4Fe-4S dicluster domain-containing protein [Candidatus Calditenuaceae archaeon]MDW8073611.1 4Fe-4S dicluster domain-containing protein [Nitrososphaerota archaeon]
MGASFESEKTCNYFLDPQGFEELILALRGHGYVVYGPVVRDGAIVYDEVESASQLPVGMRDRQGPGYYRLEERGDRAFFGFVVGPHSWKKFLYPPRVKLLTVSKKGEVTLNNGEERKMAFIGVRGCELAAIDVLDRVLLKGPYIDPIYAARKKSLFVVAVNCTEPGENCFCASMGTGPEAKTGYDISLTEVVGDGVHYFVARAGSDEGLSLLKRIGAREATREEVSRAEEKMEESQKSFRKKLNVNGLKELLYRNIESPVYAEVAERCLACTNCTMVCPTCFCTTVEEVTSLNGDVAERWRRWDSCFNLDFSYIHGGSIRSSRLSRYRQWLTHKLATWVDQFGVMGCVGCGRCITWCPVGIDITEEAEKIRRAEVEVAAK